VFIVLSVETEPEYGPGTSPWWKVTYFAPDSQFRSGCAKKASASSSLWIRPCTIHSSQMIDSVNSSKSVSQCASSPGNGPIITQNSSFFSSVGQWARDLRQLSQTTVLRKARVICYISPLLVINYQTRSFCSRKKKAITRKTAVSPLFTAVFSRRAHVSDTVYLLPHYSPLSR